MKTTILTTVAAVALVAAAPAAAQSRWTFEMRANGALPTESIGTDELDYFGLGFEATLAYRVLPHLAVYGGWDWAHFDPDGSLAGVDSDFEETGYVVGLRFEHPLGGEDAGGLSAWARAGGTVSHIEVEDGDGALVADSGHGLGWEAAAGLGLPLGKGWRLTPGLRFRSLSRDLDLGAAPVPVELRYVAFEVGFAKRF